MSPRRQIKSVFQLLLVLLIDPNLCRLLSLLLEDMEEDKAAEKYLRDVTRDQLLGEKLISLAEIDSQRSRNVVNKPTHHQN